jgi:hypothetical protein
MRVMGRGRRVGEGEEVRLVGFGGERLPRLPCQDTLSHATLSLQSRNRAPIAARTKLDSVGGRGTARADSGGAAAGE